MESTPGYHVPLATYRVQLNEAFRFRDAQAIVPYLTALGVTDLYISPPFKAHPGSAHGYDVTDPNVFNPALGTREDFDALTDALGQHNLRLLLDVVPNHMAASPHNPWWHDLLEFGQTSPYARFFDVCWSSLSDPVSGAPGILLPVLGQSFGRVLENQELRLDFDTRRFVLRYYDKTLPVAPWAYASLLEELDRSAQECFGANDPARMEVGNIASAFNELAQRSAVARPDQAVDPQEWRAIQDRLEQLFQRHPAAQEALNAVLNRFNGTKGCPGSFDALELLSNAQVYWLAFWRNANAQINYRRFFDINDLVCLRVEDPVVFEASHALVFDLLRQGQVHGLRIDHVDGLHDPLGYLRALQRAAGAGRAPEGEKTVYTLVEKILEAGEELRSDWPVCGTTGYDFLNDVNLVFVHPAGLNQLKRTYANFIADDSSFSDICHRRKREVMQKLFEAEFNGLVQTVGRLAMTDRHARDLSREQLREAVIELTARLRVYRTYIRDFDIHPHDRIWIEQAASAAHEHAPDSQALVDAITFVRRLLLLEPLSAAREPDADRLDLVTAWQKVTGPAMAKGFEDTALYVHSPLLSLNEVGGDPDGRYANQSLERFHQQNRHHRSHWPYRLTATATHDTKRGEDVRARLNVLSEIPEIWARSVGRWRRWNERYKPHVNGRSVPDAREEMLLYQTLIGAWPLCDDELPSFRQRLREYLIKAIREAKTNSSWLDIDETYESALLAFTDAIFETAGAKNRFLSAFLRLQRRVAYHGAFNSLSQIVLKMTSPGVPDVYQGTELWDLSLVDPDNRRPVDYRRRTELLENIEHQSSGDIRRLLRELLFTWQDGRIKLYVVYKVLNYRRAHRELFLDGDYLGAGTRGAKADHLCAFLRHRDHQWALAAVPRWTVQLTRRLRPPLGESVWDDTFLELPHGAPRRWYNVLTGETVGTADGAPETSALAARELFQCFPVALLSGSGDPK